jgi:dihydroxy-acid dehydratase
MKKKELRSKQWFDNPADPALTALYLERYLNYGMTREELQSGKPIIGIAQSGSDLSPCNRHFLELSSRIKDGIRQAGGIPMEFPTHPIQETGKRPTAGLDRNLSYLSLVEVLFGYPIDGVILTTGCDKTTPAALMAAATVNIPAIVLSGGPMLDGNYKGKKVGSGTVVWEARKLHAKGEITYDEFMDMVAASAPSIGHCNTMGTASSMNSIAEALGMSLTGCAVIPAPYRERSQISFETGKRIVDMVHEDLTPSKIMTKEAFENAILVASAIGASSNCPPHLTAIARHMGLELDIENWQTLGHDIPLLVNCQPAGEHLMERFYRAGGVPAIMQELLKNNKLHKGVLTVSGKTVEENLKIEIDVDADVIKSFANPLVENAGYIVMRSNFFSSAVMKTSVISEEFRKRYLSDPKNKNVFEANAVIFEGPEDYHARINNEKLNIDENSILMIRGCGPVGYPGSAEVVNMQPPDRLLKKGIIYTECFTRISYWRGFTDSSNR